jgi:hypothetical protein
VWGCCCWWWCCNALTCQSVHMPSTWTQELVSSKPYVLRVWEGCFPREGQSDSSRRIKMWLNRERFLKGKALPIIDVLLIK